MKSRYAIFFLFAVFSMASAAIINVPADYSAIQQGIDAGFDGDTVLVQPGTYVENINYNGKNLVVASLFVTTGDISYISSTIVNGNSSGTVVLFESGETGSAVLIGFTITGGNGSFGGGVSCASSSSPSITYNIISQNTTGQGGGGISCWQNCDPAIANNIIDDNSAQSFGGGILCSTNSDPTIVNCVLSGNVSNSQGGAIMSWQSNPAVINSICWGNSGTGGNEISGAAVVTYSDIAGGWAGQGNIDQDPLFLDPDNGDYHLMSVACGDSADSPCIDAGDPNEFDALLDCSWGLGGFRSDMGAYGGGELPISDISDDYLPNPRILMLNQNYPNPFNALTTIEFFISESHKAKLTIYDLLGRRVQTLIDEHRSAGSHSVTFDASGLSSGVYFYRFQAGETVETRRMVLLK